MRKLMVLAAMLAMVALVAVPAVAQVVQGIGQEAESGDVELENAVANEGDNSNVCAPTLQSANTGNLQNAQGFAQYGSETGDIEFEGSAFVVAPALESECVQSVEQSAAASS